jgi:glutamate synthase (NADPH/NADH) small chain
MGKPTGFMEYDRELPQDRSPLERLNDWEEFHEHFSEAKLQQQGARCMDCGIPFCHMGQLISGMASGCPVNNLIPEWNDLVYRGLWKEAFVRLHKTNNFPEFTGRDCPAPCEGSCVLGINELPVTIKNIECSIIDNGFVQGWVTPDPPQKRTGKQIAIVGSGPSGLACAAQLNRAGHLVTVYERADRIGGLLMYGIPNMKLDKSIVQRRVDLMAAEGVKFVTSTAVGSDLPANQLRDEFDAIVLCCGATKPRDLPIPGRELKGVYFAMDFLQANTKSLLDSGHQNGNYISATDKHVIIVGGGDTGTDCVGTAMRHQCKSLTQLEILPCPPDARQSDNPWPEWPKVYKLDYGQEEAKARFGADPRIYLTTGEKFVGNEKGQVKEFHIYDVEWTKDEKGAFIPKRVPGTEEFYRRIWFCSRWVSWALKIRFFHNSVSNVIRGPMPKLNMANSTPVFLVFCGRDCRRGQSLVVWAINEGRGAARECDRYLMGGTNLP